MPEYSYETLTKPKKRYTFKQSMLDASFTQHPESGESIRRVISGGLFIRRARPKGTSEAEGSCCPTCR